MPPCATERIPEGDPKRTPSELELLVELRRATVSLGAGQWRADRDLKLEYMFRVIKHRGRLLGNLTLLAADLDSFAREEIQDLCAKTAYFRWVRWVERFAERLGATKDTNE